MTDKIYCRACTKFKEPSEGKMRLVGKNQKQFRCNGCLAKTKAVK